MESLRRRLLLHRFLLPTVLTLGAAGSGLCVGGGCAAATAQWAVAAATFSAPRNEGEYG